jgi:acetyl-CoA decarbonylase/synthase complex subunit gamma
LGLPSIHQPFLTGFVPTTIGKVPRVYPDLTWSDRVGGYMARWTIRRMNHTVEPGLYALGNPGRNSPVLVTANYKMSFDCLRRSLPGRSGWILALDTKGINVWCAAGKGTFGTEELVRQVGRSGLHEIVSHRDLILPQLSAPGIAAHTAGNLSGFKVHFGPVRSADLPSYLDSGMNGSPELRTKTFTLWERAVLIPVELVQALKAALVALPLLFLLSGLLSTWGFWIGGIERARTFVPGVLGAILAGAVLTPLLLPWLPGRPFSVKGLLPGVACAAGLLGWQSAEGSAGLETIAWMILIPSMSTYLSMNFTGASTFTSLSGVKKEMRIALPVQIGAAVIGLGLWIYSLTG